MTVKAPKSSQPHTVWSTDKNGKVIRKHTGERRECVNWVRTQRQPKSGSIAPTLVLPLSRPRPTADQIQ